MTEPVKLVLLGASGVGKTSLIQQFVWNEFHESYHPTEKRRVYTPSVMINDRLYELRITDAPVLPYFPCSSLHEWNDFRYYGLRNANAYILVYDISAPLESFEYIRTIREQMYESRDMHGVPVLVVANKQDLGGACGSGVRERRIDRDVLSIVRKQWKCGYIECSAKYNWHVVTLFKEVLRVLDAVMNSAGGKAHMAGPARHGFPGNGHRDKCVLQ